MIFVDGLGIGREDKRYNPMAMAHFPMFSFFQNHESVQSAPCGGFAVATGATLGVSGIPQSATGQSTLLTGINCAQKLQTHLPAYPNETLRQILRDHSIFKQFLARGLRPAFLNAYRPLFFQIEEAKRWRLSATTVATLAAGLSFFKTEDILLRRCLYHDFTNAPLIAQGHALPAFSPETAADVFMEASEPYDFVLYEFFLTDRAGHSQNMKKAIDVLSRLHRFVECVVSRIDFQNTFLVLTSDHGNIEDLSIKTHTMNPALTLLWGSGANASSKEIRSLEDVPLALLRSIPN